MSDYDRDVLEIAEDGFAHLAHFLDTHPELQADHCLLVALDSLNQLGHHAATCMALMEKARNPELRLH